MGIASCYSPYICPTSSRLLLQGGKSGEAPSGSSQAACPSSISLSVAHGQTGVSAIRVIFPSFPWLHVISLWCFFRPRQQFGSLVILSSTSGTATRDPSRATRLASIITSCRDKEQTTNYKVLTPSELLQTLPLVYAGYESS